MALQSTYRSFEGIHLPLAHCAKLQTQLCENLVGFMTAFLFFFQQRLNCNDPAASPPMWYYGTQIFTTTICYRIFSVIRMCELGATWDWFTTQSFGWVSHFLGQRQQWQTKLHAVESTKQPIRGLGLSDPSIHPPIHQSVQPAFLSIYSSIHVSTHLPQTMNPSIYHESIHPFMGHPIYP